MNVSLLSLLIAAEEAGYAEAVVAAAARHDPVFRGRLRRRAICAVRAAAATTNVGDERHAIRIAFLKEAGRLDVDVADVPAVTAAFEVAKVDYANKRSFWWGTTLLFLTVAAGAAGVIAFMYWPSPQEQFQSSPVGQALGEPLTDYVQGSVKHDGAKVEKGEAGLFPKGIDKQIGESGKTQFRAVLDGVTKANSALTKEEQVISFGKLDEAAATFNAMLMDRTVPAFVDTYLHSEELMGTVWVLSYYATERADVSLAGKHFDVRWGHRLDTLPIDEDTMVHERIATNTVLVFLDKIAGWVISHVVPTLTKPGYFDIGLPYNDMSMRGRMQKRCGELVRQESLAAAQLDVEDGAALADLLSQRAAAIHRLHDAVTDKTVQALVERPMALELPQNVDHLFRKRDDLVDTKELFSVQEQLGRGAFRRAFPMMLSAQAKIEEEEMLEWATFDNAALATEALAKVLGEEHPSNDSLPARARASLASWLITLTRIPSSTYTLLSEYVGDVFDPNDPQRVTATKVLFYALEEDMGMAPKWLSSLSEFDEDGFANSTIQLLGRPAAEIRKTAEATYTRLFGRPVPPIVRTKR